MSPARAQLGAELDAADLRVLAYLRTEALAGRGWTWRGVAGWRFFHEVAVGSRTHVMSDRLSVLARRGYLHAADVREPDRRTPLNLYRVTELGARTAALHARGESHHCIPAPLECDPADAGSVFMPDGSWTVLTTLRAAVEAERGPRRWGRYGWMTGAEVRNVSQGCRRTYIDTPHSQWLVRLGLAERREEPGNGPQGRANVFWRVTDYGRRVELLADRGEPEADRLFVQVRVALPPCPPELLPTLPNTDLVWRLLAGDDAALLPLYERHQASVRAELRAAGVRRGELEEKTGAVFDAFAHQRVGIARPPDTVLRELARAIARGRAQPGLG